MAAERIEKLMRSNAEWKKLLTPAQYHILREEGTERPYSNPLNQEQRAVRVRGVRPAAVPVQIQI
jgi:peptide-methionine (R)-S-oxide reductase